MQAVRPVVKGEAVVNNAVQSEASPRNAIGVTSADSSEVRLRGVQIIINGLVSGYNIN
ncbi:hypothetical protein Barb7_02318 [Bacteroidales bacterium Barb7]|nr:hypothetical protein Barb7_02318 [Bacteroidales bacterium Barb7]